MSKLLLLVDFIVVLGTQANEYLDFNVTEIDRIEELEFGFSKYSSNLNPLLVGLTLIRGADSGAVCLDGTLPGYHLHRGRGSGAKSWLIQLEGGGWCNNVRTCVYRKKTRRGSSNYMEKQLQFTGILSDKAQENPDFFNWNRVKLRYCDGASFSGDGQNQAAQLQFRGERIWRAAIADLKAKGMRYANQALLSGCSAGGLAAILRCDEFRNLFPGFTKVKCLSDAGLFLDTADVSGGRTIRNLYNGVVNFQSVKNNLPRMCTNHLDPTSCFFPQNLISQMKTPLFIVNAAYDTWQIQSSIAPTSADPSGFWHDCRLNHAKCTPSQIRFLQGFRDQMLRVVRGFSMSRHNGLFINSCFAHCQTERQDTWFADDSPVIRKKAVAIAVGDWYFDRAEVKLVDCPYPCDKSCHNLLLIMASDSQTATATTSEKPVENEVNEEAKLMEKEIVLEETTDVVKDKPVSDSSLTVTKEESISQTPAADVKEVAAVVNEEESTQKGADENGEKKVAEQVEVKEPILVKEGVEEVKVEAGDAEKGKDENGEEKIAEEVELKEPTLVKESVEEVKVEAGDAEKGKDENGEEKIAEEVELKEPTLVKESVEEVKVEAGDAEKGKDENGEEKIAGEVEVKEPALVKESVEEVKVEAGDAEKGKDEDGEEKVAEEVELKEPILVKEGVDEEVKLEALDAEKAEEKGTVECVAEEGNKDKEESKVVDVSESAGVKQVDDVQLVRKVPEETVEDKIKDVEVLEVKPKPDETTPETTEQAKVELVGKLEDTIVVETKDSKDEQTSMINQDSDTAPQKETEGDASSPADVTEKAITEEKHVVEEPSKDEQENVSEAKDVATKVATEEENIKKDTEDVKSEETLKETEGNKQEESVTEKVAEAVETAPPVVKEIEEPEVTTKEVVVKQKSSNSLMSKVKKSLVKAKKAITGKSPSSKTISTQEAKETSKPSD
ncbi:hypothetical protein HID58_068861 [Brassica napus]|uniref:Pectin acetylesterase n=2 Tax=Brassica napus TaxID=3708 RepID=A0ABQ7ZN47_BRANA|nr:hypothetical protein HID58_068861 [Brassica napus]